MIDKYQANDLNSRNNALKEVVQEIVLCGLSRSGFFKDAAFYGGTALRIFYGLDRFSEDLDFSLIETNSEFSLEKHINFVRKEAASFGLNVEVEEKTKSIDSHIKSAFLKGNTKEHLLMFYPESDIVGISPNEKVKIKFEIDIDPPPLATYENRFKYLPFPHEVRLYSNDSLFAGKLHAVLGRSWHNRIKGRDLYDYLFYISRGIPVNLMHLRARLEQSGHVESGTELSNEIVKAMLVEKFESIDYKQASMDVKPFIKNPSAIDIWSRELFLSTIEHLTFK